MKLRRVNRLRGLALLALMLGTRPGCAQGLTEPQVQIPQGASVLAIHVVRENGTVLVEEPKGLAVQVGKPVNPDEVAASLRTLYQTGDYADLRAVLTPEGNGVRLDFVAKESLFLNQVTIHGLKPPPSEASAVAAMQLSLGQTYHPRDLGDALTKLKDVLRDEGLYQAKVTAETKTYPDTHQLDIIATVDPGPRVLLGGIELLNNTSYTDGELLRLFKLKTGRELTVGRQQSATERIRKFLEKRNYLSARVSLRRGAYNEHENTVPLTLEVTEGPRVQVEVIGAKFSKGELKKLVPVYQEGSVDTDLLEEGKRNIRERLERDGYFDASVFYSVVPKSLEGAKEKAKGTEETISYKVDRGEHYKLLRIEFNGNQYFNTELLRSLLTITPSSIAVRQRFSRRLLESDVQSLKSLYAANGFLIANVEGKIEKVPGKTGDLIVQFSIQEGKQTLVASLKLEGMQTISEKTIRGVIGSLPGQPYSDINVATDRDNILALYFNDGFPNASFSWTAEPDNSPNADPVTDEQPPTKSEKPRTGGKSPGASIERAEPMRLVYRVEEGTQVHVKQVLLSGYVHTRPNVIERQVMVKPNEPLREGDVVASQQRLYNLGIFNRVTVGPLNAAGTDPDKDVVVLVEEAKRYTIAYGGGFEVQRLASTTNPTGGEIQAAPRGILEIAKQNLTGRADTLTLKLRASTIQGRALLGYTAPNAFGDPKLSFQATAYGEKSQDVNTFSQTRYEGNLQLAHKFNSRSSLLYRYVFRKVTVSNLQIPPEEVPLFNQPTLVSQFGVTWFRDTRDNPADAKKGSFNTADVSIAGTAIGSSANFVRLYFQNSGYTPFARGWTYARSIRIGLLEPYGNTVSLSFPAPTQTPLPTVIPLPERFFAGGGTSLRGVALNQAGPRDSITGFPVGGQALMIFNQEIHFPMKLPYVGRSLGGALFYDGGNTYSQLSHVTFRWLPPTPVFKPVYSGVNPGRFNPSQCLYNCTNELNYFSHTVGVGLRYATPIGPIRVDLGYQLNRSVFVIPCKNSSVFCQQGTRLPRLQVFFNLGSSF